MDGSTTLEKSWLRSVSGKLHDGPCAVRPQNEHRQWAVYAFLCGSRCPTCRMERCRSLSKARSICNVRRAACRWKMISILPLVVSAFVLQFCLVQRSAAQDTVGNDAVLRGNLSKWNISLQCFRNPVSNLSGAGDLQIVFVNSYYRVTDFVRDTRR